jgi:hypothetical protein
MDNDWMEIGDTGLIPVQDGFLDTINNQFIDAEGRVWEIDEDGEILDTQE